MYKLGDIIKASANVRPCEQEGAPAHVISEFKQLLQFHVATYMDNDIAGIPQTLQKSGHPGKEGRLQGNLMGKCVDFSVHTVITGDPNLELDEVDVLHSTGECIDLHYNKCTDAFLQYGWVVERHLKDRDFNFMKLYNTPPYNADFDGDKMNKLVPQSEETWAELSQIAWVPCQIISPQANKPVMGIVQDMLCGIHKFTLCDTFLNWNQVQNILLWVPDWDGSFLIPSILKPKPLWTGKQILSLTIPCGINIHQNPDPKSSNPVFDGSMLIENGEIIFGIVEKKTIGALQGGLAHATRGLLTGLQQVVNYWLFHNRFSIGIGNTIADKGTMFYITEMIAKSFKSLVELELNLACDKSGQYAQKGLKEANNVKQMVVAGSKGSFINILQMSVCVGQQSVEGCQIPFCHCTLLHFTKDDFLSESQGFVKNSYLHGLTLQEFFFHAMAGCEGLIDTAVKTAKTGYIQCQLVKALKDIMVHYNGTMRNSLGDLIQFVYGEDGMDGAFIKKQNIDMFSLNDQKFEHNYCIDVTDPAGGFLPGILQVGIDDSSLELQKKLDKEYKQLYLPVNLSHIVQNVTQIFHIDRWKLSNLNPAFIIDSVKALCNHLIVVHSDDSLSCKAQANASLASICICRQCSVMGEVEAKFNQLLANPGEMCGTLAAQSIGEPATQMMLNTFHYASVSSKNMTLGVPCLKEIINVATNIKTPLLSVYLKPAFRFDANLAKNVQQELAYTTLCTVTTAVEIWYDPNPTSTIIKEDEVFIESFFAIPNEEVELKLHLQLLWLLCLELDHAKMLDCKLTMAYVASQIAERFKTDLFVIWSEDNMEKLIIHCCVLGVFLTTHDSVETKEDGSILMEKEKQWVLETDSVNLKTVMCIGSVDFARTYSNSCVEVFNVLGIEAAQASILKELHGVIEFDSSYVNYCHLAILCDLMTHRGSLMAITQHGINCADTGTLMRCSFKETVKILMEAAAVRENDNCQGVTENVMFGQMAPMGTGTFEVALDIDMLKDPMLAAQVDGGMSPGQVAMTPYDTNSPMWDSHSFKGGEQAAFLLLAVNNQEEASNFPYLGWGTSSMGARGMSPGGPTYSPSSLNAYSPTSPGFMPQSLFNAGATSPIPRYSSTLPSFLPMSPWYSPQSPLFSPMSPQYSPTSPSFSPTSPQ
ncbi:hypothetical protein GYMLUDRAFT_43543, partial [Collybiopsis luxurians FD-317 M1]